MSTLRKMLEGKKADILADAERRAAEVDADIEKLEQLTAKYGLEIAASGVNGRAATSTISDVVAKTLANLGTASVSAKAKAGAEAYIRAKNHPTPLGEIHEVLERNGVKFEGDTPRNTLSAILGQHPPIYSISRDQGWWLKDVPVPSGGIRRRVFI
jgi:hypothetical protein